MEAVLEALGLGGFGDVTGGSERKGVEGGGGSLFGEGAAHDDGEIGLAGLEFAQGIEAVHFRHVYVEGDDVRLEFFETGERDSAVCGGSDHFDLRVAREGFGYGESYEGGVVDDEDPYFVHHGDAWGAQGLSPRRVSLSLTESFVKGFIKYSSAPDSSAAMTFSASDSVVIIMIFMTSLPGRWRISFTNSSPFISGIFQSTQARSGNPFCSIQSMASRP